MSQRRRAGWSTEVQDVVDRVFVYGTLRAGEPARALIANHEMASVEATVPGRIYAFSDGYPGLVDPGGGDKAAAVAGEVVYLNDLAAAFALLDAYEGSDFVRILRRAYPRRGGELWAWIYVLADPSLTRGASLIEDGDWVAHRARAPG